MTSFCLLVLSLTIVTSIFGKGIMEKSKSIIATARLVAKPGEEARLKSALKLLIAATRREPGSISYSFYQSDYDKHLFISHEIWESHEVFARHLESAYIQALLDEADEILAEPLQVMFLNPIE